MVQKKKLIIPAAALLLLVGAGTGIYAVAHADTTSGTTTGTSHQRGTPPAAMGTVTAVNGDTITLTDKRNNTTYTVDATNATITKFVKPTTDSTTTGSTGSGTKPTSETITVSQIAVGDMLTVQGTASGDDITATSIRDGVGGFGDGRGGPGGMGMGQGVMGTVSAVNGNTITVTGKNGTTYTIDASSATVEKMETISASDIAVGDSVGVQGTVSGSDVTAKNIMDGMPTPPANSQSDSSQSGS